MALRTTYSAEAWEKIYQAFTEVSFVSYDFDSIKQSLIDYTRTYYPEVFNDYIESSEYIAMLEMFAYIAEQLAYRVDMVAHENFITTAQRKQSILRLAKLISYKATRNIPVRGLVKINTVTTTERLLDSRGTDLAGLTITWNDPNNANWKEQFILVMNRLLNNRFGQPSKTFQIGDVVMDLYSLRNDPASLRNGVFPFSAAAGQDSYPMEIVPADIDANGPFEREPDLTSPMSIIYANDGIGDGSDYTGFLGYVKQGTLTRVDYNIEARQPDRRIDFDPTNVNHTDVWVQKIDSDRVSERWTQVDTVSEQNLVFNDIRETRRKFEVDTRENDMITVIFGDGDFSDMPQGLFRFWMRQSANRSIVIQKNKVVGEQFGFSYTSTLGNTESCAMTFSLTTTLQNGAATETIEHIRRSAPSTYYAQNRMVNGQDYNTYLLKDPTIIRVKAINRTFAGQPKFIDWNDASGTYENVKLFGDDVTMRYRLDIESQTTSVSGQALIDNVIEPLLNSSGVINMMLHISATDPITKGVVSSPRRKFIEDNRGGKYFDIDGTAISDGSLKEKTTIQGLIDRHWYGEPLEYVQDSSGAILARIPDPDEFPKDDSRIYAATVPRTIDGVNKFPPGDIGSGLQPIAEQDDFALRYHRYTAMIGEGEIEIDDEFQSLSADEVWTLEVAADGTSMYVRSNLRGTLSSATIGKTQDEAEWYDVKSEGSATSKPFFRVWSATALEPGDAFILEGLNPVERENGRINLNGWWEVMGTSDVKHYEGGQIKAGDELLFTTDMSRDDLAQHGWLIFVHKLRQAPSNRIIGYEVHNRTLKLSVTSPNTKFWFNSVGQIIDNDTKNRVYDNIKILGSNLDANDPPRVLQKGQKYDVIGAIKDADGVVDVHSLEVVPTDLLNEDESGDLVPDRLLQFETFSAGSYEYYLIANEASSITATEFETNQLPAVQFEGTQFPAGDLQFYANSDTGMVFMAADGLWGEGVAMDSGTSLPAGDAADGTMFVLSQQGFVVSNTGTLHTVVANGWDAGVVVPQGNVNPTDDLTDGDTFYNIIDGKLYTVVSGAWDAGVDAQTGSQLPADGLQTGYQFRNTATNKIHEVQAGWTAGADVSVNATGDFPTSFADGNRFLHQDQEKIYTVVAGAWADPYSLQEGDVVTYESTGVEYTFADGEVQRDAAGSTRVNFECVTGSKLFAPGSFVDSTLTYGRRQRMPVLTTSGESGLDFMWQHFSPFTNIIDPSVTNIHDAYLMTRGYYDNVINYVRGISPYAPTAPTPLELRNSYGYLLNNKMLSDTVVLHPGKIRLLFGGLAEPQLRARFKVVRSQSGTLTNERIKEEVLNVINTFFDIDGWDFGDTFYATKLISLIHQRLPADIASVVLVPVYSTNSFGSLFTVEAGFDEILQSAAELSDIEVVEALTPVVIRQSK